MTNEVHAMPTVKLLFLGGRYHATPWGHHVNEGLIEWPPSPWRLLRAFIACGFSSQGWSEVPPLARRLIDKLAAVLPSYRLPPASAAHSRHFMPVGVLAKGREQTTLVFDTWANVGYGELLIHWPCELDAEEVDLFGKLTTTLGYLGRSESWVEAQLTDEVSAAWNAVPCVDNERRGPGWEQVSLMAAISPSDYEQWRLAQVEEALRPFQGQKQTSPAKKKQTQAIEPYPSDLLSCLTKDTTWWKGHGWSQPPGSQRVLYWRRNDALQVGVPTILKRAEPHGIECMLLAITSPSGNVSALPHVRRTVPQAEHLRRALICRAANGERIHCPSLLGKDENGPLRDRHEHAHLVPLDLDGDQHLDHILIYAKGKLCGTAQHAVRTLERTWTKGGVGDLQLALVGSGSVEDLLSLPAEFKQSLQAIAPPYGAQIWESATPFVLPRFLKSKGKDTLEGQVQAELAARGMPAADTIEWDRKLSINLRHFVRRRTHGGVPPKVDAGYGLRLHFAKPIPGPLLLGYASHYGLGLFRACVDEPPDYHKA